MSLNINYHNVDFLNQLNEKKFIPKIHTILKDLPALCIVKDKILLDETIKKTKKFSEKKENFVILGTGGSNLGSKALINILLGRENKKIFFYDNIDPLSFKNSIDQLNIENTAFIVISKSGSTPETISQFASLIEYFEQKDKLNFFFSNTLVITEDKESPLTHIAYKNNCTTFKHEDNIGGRYSIFSNVGMVPAIIAGLDVKQIHAGALSAFSKYDEDRYLKLPQFFKYQRNSPILSSSVTMTYSDALFYFGKWYLQLWSESIGKDNKGITGIHAKGTTDQHSQLQLYLDGPKDKFFTFITTNHKKKGLKIHSQTMKESGVDYLVDKTMGDLMEAEQKATLDTFKKNNFSCREIYIPEINEFSIGKLMAFSIMETVAACLYLEVNPFDQPAVEQGKILTKKYLL